MSLQPPLSQARSAAQHRSLPFLFQSPVPSSVSLAVVEALAAGVSPCPSPFFLVCLAEPEDMNREEDEAGGVLAEQVEGIRFSAVRRFHVRPCVLDRRRKRPSCLPIRG
jgi:hypothetical protein